MLKFIESLADIQQYSSSSLFLVGGVGYIYIAWTWLCVRSSGGLYCCASRVVLLVYTSTVLEVNLMHWVGTFCIRVTSAVRLSQQGLHFG